ncbi:MAG: N-acetylmuramoyl-L-alanine amidase [Geodermatophilaceae bacterium]
MRRRLALLLIYSALITPAVLVLPVWADEGPAPEPVSSDVAEVPMGTVSAPEGAAEVQAGTTEPIPGAETAPTLAVSQPETAPFSAVGVTWLLDPAVVATQVNIRVRDTAGGWGDWFTAELDNLGTDANPEALAAGELRGGTEPVWTGNRVGVEVEILTLSGAAPQDVAAVLIDPNQSPADSDLGSAAVQDTANAATRMPAIFSRAQWGADESVMTWDPEYAPTIKAATIHHTADSNTYTADQVPAMLRSIYQYHAVSRGWGDIGYNVIVDKFGRAWEGRQGGLASTVIGAHAGGFNTSTFGVSMIGNYDVVDTPPEMISTVVNVISWKLGLYGVNPRGTTTLTSSGGGTSKYPAGVAVTLPTIFGHRDVGSTTCPGQYSYNRLPEIRERVAYTIGIGSGVESTAHLRSSFTEGPADWSLPRGQWTDVVLACDWNGDGFDDIGIYRHGQFFLFNDNIATTGYFANFAFGNTYGDIPVCGDFDGDGKDSVGVFRTGVFYLRNANSAGPAQGIVYFGSVSATPLMGDWNGDGFDTPGVYQDLTFHLTNSNTRPTTDQRFAFGDMGDVPLAGDWDGDGRDTVGVWRGAIFYLANSPQGGRADIALYYGVDTDTALVGDWDGNGIATVGVARGY